MIKRKVGGKFYTMDEQDFVKFGHESPNPITVIAYHVSFKSDRIIETTPLFRVNIESNNPDWRSITNYLEDLGIKPVGGFTSRIFYKVLDPDCASWKFSSALEVKKVYQIMKALSIF